MTGNAPRKDSDRMASELTRARRRAAFISTIRQASQVDVAAARPSARSVTALATRPAIPQPNPRAEPPVQRPSPPSRPRARPVVAGPRPERQLATIVEPWARDLATREEPLPPARPAREDGKRAREVAPTQPRARRTTPSVQVVEAPPAAQPSPNLFREQAIKHRLSSEEGRGLVRVSPPWTWALLWIVVLGLGSALVASFVGQVEVTSRARGIMRPAAGVRALTSQLTGTVTRVDARSGDHVKAGAPLLRIESASTQAQLLEAERELDAVRTRFAGVALQEDQHYAEQVENLKSRAARLTDQIASLRGSVAHQERRFQADQQLLKKGLVSEIAVGDTRDSLAQAQRQLSGAETTLDQTRQELASMEARRQDELWQRQQLLSKAQNKRDALAVVMQQSVIQAPEDGTVDALLAQVGETVQAGQTVGKIIPTQSPLQVVSFLAEKDRAFAKAGDEVQLELDQLPHAEYGTLRAKVVRIGDDLASPSEVREAMGDGLKLESPAYRVELAITDAHAADAAGVKLRTGTLLNARFTLRRQKLVTLFFNPLKKWFR